MLQSKGLQRVGYDWATEQQLFLKIEFQSRSIASKSFLMSQLFTSGDQSIGASASASVLPVTIQDWFPLGFTGVISCSPRDSQEFSPTPQFKSISSLVFSLLYGPVLTYIHSYWKHHSFYYTDLCGKVMSLFLNIISRFVNCSLNQCNCTKIPATVSWTAYKATTFSFIVMLPGNTNYWKHAWWMRTKTSIFLYN